jgi:hypothetical protein
MRRRFSALRQTRVWHVFGFAFLLCLPLAAQTRKSPRLPEVGPRAVVIDERLSALRDAPNLTAKLLQRLSRGRVVAVSGLRKTPDGLTFYRVFLSRKTSGWLQAEAVATPSRAGDDERTWEFVQASDDFERISRARLFVDWFPKSARRASALLLLGDAAETAAGRLSRDAGRRLEEDEMAARGAPEFSYFLNYNGLDRYNRTGVRFVFNPKTKRFHYDGAVWREVARRYPNSPEAAEAQKRLDKLTSLMAAAGGK